MRLKSARKTSLNHKRSDHPYEGCPYSEPVRVERARNAVVARDLDREPPKPYVFNLLRKESTLSNEYSQINDTTANRSGDNPIDNGQPAEMTSVDLQTWDQALVDATRVVLSLNGGLSVSSMSVDRSEPVETIDYRPEWLQDDELRGYFQVLRDKTLEMIDHATGLVRARRYRAYNDDEAQRGLDEAVWPLANVLDAISDGGFFAKPDYVEIGAETVLRSAWPTIRQLASELCVRHRLSAFDVWDIIIPDTTRWLETDAFHLAAFAHAVHHLGATPTYLSIFNLRGYGTEYRITGEWTNPLDNGDLGALAIVGEIASSMATGKMVVTKSDPFYQEAVKNINRTRIDTDDALGELHRRFGPAVKAFVLEEWDAIVRLAQLLLREYSLIGDEITGVLRGGTIEDWTPLY